MHLLAFMFACGPAPSDLPPEGTPSGVATSTPAPLAIAKPGITAVYAATGALMRAPSDAEPWEVTFQTTAFGRMGQLASVSPVEPDVTAGRTEYVRPGLVEWYEPRNTGVKQGFDVLESPAGEGPLEVALEVRSELFPLFQEDTLSFLDARRQVRLTYTGLVTFDATGAELDSWMTFDCEGTCTLRLLVDDAAATYPLTIDPLAFSNEVILTTGVTDESFGSGVALSGDLAIVGARLNDDVANNAGKAYIYRRSGLVWALEQELDSASAASARCGASVAITTDRAVVGCDNSNEVGATRSGAANVYRLDAGTWVHEAKLLASSPENRERFGHVVDIDPSGEHIIVGAPGYINNNSSNWRLGSAHIFGRSGVAWSFEARVADGTINANLRSGFGYSVGIDGTRAVVGAPLRDSDLLDAGFDDGAVFFYEDAGGASWSEVAMVADSSEGDQLGKGVAIDGTTAAAGRPFANGGGGTATVFVDSGGWATQATLVPTDDLETDRFGEDVEIEGDRVVVGARRDDSGGSAQVGSLLVYSRSGVSWSLEVEAYADQGTTSDDIGTWVDISGDWIIAGTQRSGGLEERAHLWQLTDCVAVTGQIGCDIDLTITEVHPSPVNATNGQFVEIHNAGLSNVQLFGATLATDAGPIVISHSLVVQSDGHGVIIDDVDAATNGGVANIPLHHEAGLSLGLAADTVVLIGTDATTLAEMSYAGFASSGASINLSYTGTYADPAVSFDLPITTGSWCETWSPLIEGSETNDFMTPGSFNDECGRTLPFDYNYVQTVGSFGDSTTVTLDGTGLFTTGNSGEGVASRTTDGAGQTLTFLYDVTGVRYISFPRDFGTTCFDGGFMDPGTLPAGFVSGTWDNPTCP